MYSAACLLGVLLVCLSSTGKCNKLPIGTFGLECLDRYFRLMFDTRITGDHLRFEASRGSGIHSITEEYAAECGYSISLLPHLGLAELRASYFACDALNEDDATFTFSFNIIVMHEDQEETYTVNKTCSPTLPWSSRELNCEENYMELTMRNDMHFPTGSKGNEWSPALDTAHSFAQREWQVLFQKGEQQMIPMTLATARERGYTIGVTTGRVVFRAPYHQQDSTLTLVDGVPVDTVHALMFSRKGWTVLTVDLLAACPTNDGFYNGSSLVLVTPLETDATDPQSRRIRFGANGQLLEPAAAMELGYDMETTDSAVHIIIPYNAEGGYRKSFVMDNVYREYYVFKLYLEQQFVDQNRVDTRLRQFRTLGSPLLSQPCFFVNETALAERAFTVYLGTFADDVELTGVSLTGVESFVGPLASANISKVTHPNHTHGYTLKMPFDHPVVLMELSEEGILQYTLNINYTLSIVPELQSFHHHVTVVAVFRDVFPPVFETHCFEKGIGFKLDLGPFADLWVVYAGPYPLTEELALEQEYIMSNDGGSLILNVPLFSAGYVYKNISMRTFSGTFEVHVRDVMTLKVRGTTAKTCQFVSSEMILCSPTGQVTVVANLSMAKPSGGDPYSPSLLDRTCGAKEEDGSMALFTFGLNTCGTRVKLANEVIVYENEVVFEPKFPTAKGPRRDAVEAPERVTVQCRYHLSGLYRLFKLHKFDSDFSGVGSFRHIKALGQPALLTGVDPAPAPRPTASSAGGIANDIQQGDPFSEGLDED